MSHSKGNWKVGKHISVVVTDNPEGFPIGEKGGYDDKEYYGGCLIAESILKPDDAKLIAAAPDLLSGLQSAISCIKNCASTVDEFSGMPCDSLMARMMQQSKSAWSRVRELEEIIEKLK